MSNLEKLKERKKQIEATIKKIENVENTKKRKADARKKIIVGGTVLALAETDSKVRKWLDEMLDKAVKNLKDRAFLGLPSEQ